MPEPLVSVVIPSFNTAEYARGAVASVLAQTHRNHEVVLVDDGSKPEAARALEEVARQERVRLVRQENQGPARARRHGWEAAHGEFVSFLDDDDRYEPAYLEKCVACFASEPRHGAVYTRYVFVTREGEREARVLPAGSFRMRCARAR
jgi:glycosyltransferase involved in cell wall biosynthesis